MLAREFLEAKSGAKRLARPAAEGSGSRISGRGKVERRGDQSKLIEGTHAGEPSLANNGRGYKGRLAGASFGGRDWSAIPSKVKGLGLLLGAWDAC